MNHNKKPGWKEWLSNWTSADYMTAAIVITTINVALVAIQILWLLLR